MIFSKNHLEAIRQELNKISALSDHTTETILTNLGNVMTETWNKEEIEAAFEEVTYPIGGSQSERQEYIKNQLVSVLTKTALVFKVGEVVYGLHTKSYYINTGLCTKDACRHLNLTENPSTALAIERLEMIAMGADEIAGFDAEDIAQTALDDIKELL